MSSRNQQTTSYALPASSSSNIAGSPVSAVRRASQQQQHHHHQQSIMIPQPPSSSSPLAANNTRKNSFCSSSSALQLPQRVNDDDDNNNAFGDENEDQQNNLPVMMNSTNDPAADASIKSDSYRSTRADSVTLQAMINKDLSRYAQEDLNQCRELYQTLLETGALKVDSENGEMSDDMISVGGLPNAFHLLGSEIPGKQRRKSGVLKALIRKHQLGVDKTKKSAVSFQALVNMLCVPIREKRYVKSGDQTYRHQLQQQNRKKSVALMTPEELLAMKSSNDETNSSNNDGKTNNSNNSGRETPNGVLSSLVGRGADTSSRSSSPDLFGDLRSNSPSTPLPRGGAGNSGHGGNDDDDFDANENSPERILEKLNTITGNQSERSRRAKRVISLSRKELYAACEIQPVSAYNAGHDLGKMKRKTNANHPLLADDEAKAETARYMRQMATPRGIAPAPFHGAAARSIGDVPFQQQYHPSSPPTSARRRSTSARHQHQQQPQQRPPLSPRTPSRSNNKSGVHFQPSSSSRPQSGRKSSSYTQFSDDETNSINDSSFLTFDDDDDSADENNNEASVSRRTPNYPSGRNATTAARKKVRSGRLHAVINEPERYKSKQGVVHNLSARVKMREAQRAMEEEQDELGSYATPRTLARRLRKIEAGEKVKMFDDPDSKILQRWIR